MCIGVEAFDRGTVNLQCAQRVVARHALPLCIKGDGCCRCVGITGVTYLLAVLCSGVPAFEHLCAIRRARQCYTRSTIQRSHIVTAVSIIGHYIRVTDGDLVNYRRLACSRIINKSH